MVNWI